MKIGIFSGSFNPIHIGHIILANYVIEHADIDQVWFLVTPQNPLKEEGVLLNESERLEMVKLATAPYEKMCASDFEFHLPRPSYTVATLNALRNSYPEHEFTLMIGSDNWTEISNWKDYEWMLSQYKLLVYPRLDHQISIPKKLRSTVEALDSPVVEISSSFIREELKEGKNIRPFVPVEVYEYIKEKKLYSEAD
mgnify:CR=1 FL=1